MCSPVCSAASWLSPPAVSPRRLQPGRPRCPGLAAGRGLVPAVDGVVCQATPVSLVGLSSLPPSRRYLGYNGSPLLASIVPGPARLRLNSAASAVLEHLVLLEFESESRRPASLWGITDHCLPYLPVSTMASFALKDATVENLRPLKVRVIGAGYSGIVAAIRFVSPSFPFGGCPLTARDTASHRSCATSTWSSTRRRPASVVSGG